MLPEKGYLRVLVIILYTAIVILALFFGFKYILPSLLPFITAFLLISAAKPLISFCVQKLGISKKLASGALTVVLVSTLSLILYFAVSRLLHETVTLAAFLANGGLTDMLEMLSVRVSDFLRRIPGGSIGSTLSDSVSEKILNADKLLLDFAGNFYPKIVEKIMSFLAFFPQAVVFTVLMFISMFYIGSDYEKIVSFISAQFSGKSKEFVSSLKNQFFKTVKDLFRAYLFLTLITFSELLTGFLILKVNYAVILALIISFVDMLPIFGTGTILVPWSVISLFLGDTARAVGLLVLYGIITVFRQMLEPKIVGGSIGLYPLVTLIAMYAGVRFMGFSGLFVFPIGAIIIKSLNEREIIRLYKNAPESDVQKLENTRKKFARFKSLKNK